MKMMILIIIAMTKIIPNFQGILNKIAKVRIVAVNDFPCVLFGSIKSVDFYAVKLKTRRSCASHLLKQRNRKYQCHLS